MCRGINTEIKLAAKKAGVYLWEIADQLGIQDSAFSRRLRRELLPQDRNQILRIIDDLAAKKREVK